MANGTSAVIDADIAVEEEEDDMEQDDESEEGNKQAVNPSIQFFNSDDDSDDESDEDEDVEPEPERQIEIVSQLNSCIIIQSITSAEHQIHKTLNQTERIISTSSSHLWLNHIQPNKFSLL